MTTRKKVLNSKFYAVCTHLAHIPQRAMLTLWRIFYKAGGDSLMFAPLVLKFEMKKSFCPGTHFSVFFSFVACQSANFFRIRRVLIIFLPLFYFNCSAVLMDHVIEVLNFLWARFCFLCVLKACQGDFARFKHLFRVDGIICLSYNVFYDLIALFFMLESIRIAMKILFLFVSFRNDFTKILINNNFFLFSFCTIEVLSTQTRWNYSSRRNSKSFLIIWYRNFLSSKCI